MKSPLWTFVPILSLFLAPLAGAEVKPLMIYGVSIGEERVAAVKFFDKDGERVLEQVQSEPLGARMSAITYLSRSKMLYMGATDGSGFVYRVKEDGMIERVTKKKFKSGYCFLTPDRTGNFLLGASYNSGNVDIYKLDETGLPTELTASRNEGKEYAHAVGISPDNKAVYLPFVKKNNSLNQYRFDPDTGKLEPHSKPTADVGEGAGPRHVVTHPNKPFVYFSNEQQLGISIYKVGDDGALTFMGMSDAPDTTPAKGLSGSDIVITPDGRFVYSGLRGKPADGVAGYAVQDNGMLEPIDRTATDSIPWALGMSPRGDRLFVSASRAGTLTAFKIKDDGSLEKEAILKLGKDFWDILVLDVGAGL